MKKNYGKRCLSLLITVIMVFTMLFGTAATAYAVENDGEPAVVETVVSEDSAEEAEQEEPQVTEEPAKEETAKEEPVSTEAPQAPNAVEEKDHNTSEAEMTGTDAAGEETAVEEVVVSSEEEFTTKDEAKNAVSHDLSDHIRSLEIIGNPESVEDGEKITVKFGWLIEGEVHGGADTFTYTLPVNFGIENASTGSITKGDHGDVIGQYHVSTDGIVTITYNSDYNTSNQTTINYMEITGDAKYGESSDGHKIKFTWQDGEKVIVVTNPGDFDVEKLAVRQYEDNVLGNNSTISYTVTIASDLGTNGAFTISDTFTAKYFLTTDEIAYDKNSFELVSSKGNKIAVSPVINGNTFTIENVPALSKNETYTLTYNLKVKQTGNLKNGSATIGNKVSVSNDSFTHTDEKTITYRQNVTKTFRTYENNTSPIVK